MITCKDTSTSKIEYGSLVNGDTFLYDGRPCIIAGTDRGQRLPLFLDTSDTFSIDDKVKVVLIECALEYYRI